MMSQQNYAEQLNCRMVQQSQNRNCNEILAAKPQTNKKRSIGVVEPRVVVKIPLAPKVRGADTGNNNTNSNSNTTTTGSANDFLQPADSSSLSHTSEAEGQNNSNTS